MKLAGFLTGAGLAGVAVWAFAQWSDVSDDDRLVEILRDHCLPYVQSATVPFVDMGRAPGVYDAIELDEGLIDGGGVLLHNNRFIAQWGVRENAGPQGDQTFRVCDVAPTYGENTVAGFEVKAEGFVARYTALIAEFEPLRPEADTLENGPVAFGWFDAQDPRSKGLRVVMTAAPGLVSSFVVGREITR